MGKEGEDSWGDPWIHFPLGGRIWLTPCKASGGGGGGGNGEGVMLERYLHRSILLYTIVLSSGASGEMIYPELRDLGYLMPRQCARMISDTVVVGSIPWYAFLLAPKCFNQEMISTMLRWKMVWCDEHWVWHRYTRCDHEPTQKHSQHVITYSYTCEYLIPLGQVKKGPSNNKKNWTTFFCF